MDESQLLNKLIELESSSRWLEIQIQLWHDGDERNKYIAQKTEVDDEIDVVSGQLVEIPEKKYSARAKQYIIDQLREYKNQIGNIKNPYKLLPYDSINIENSLFSNLNSHIKAITIGKQWGIHIPILGYTRDENENNVEIENFLEFIDQEIDNVRNIENSNFVELKNYQEQFQQRIIDRFIH